MRVTDLARQCGVPAHVIRYYTQFGLLTPRRRSSNGYRDYAPTDVSRVRFIRRATQLGFTLRDVRAILDDADCGVSPCPQVRRTIRVRVAENRARVDDLVRLQARMEAAILRWDSMPDRLPTFESLCHLIDTVADVDEN